MSTARIRLPATLDQLLRSELEVCIQEANLGTVDERIAREYMLDKTPQVEIAAELDWTRTTMSRHIKHIVRKVEETSRRLELI